MAGETHGLGIDGFHESQVMAIGFLHHLVECQFSGVLALFHLCREPQQYLLFPGIWHAHHSTLLNDKSGTSCLSHLPTSLFVTIHESQQVQQAGEQVENRYVQRHGRHDVVGLAAVDDVAGLVQDQSRHQQHEHG